MEILYVLSFEKVYAISSPSYHWVTSTPYIKCGSTKTKKYDKVNFFPQDCK